MPPVNALMDWLPRNLVSVVAQQGGFAIAGVYTGGQNNSEIELRPQAKLGLGR
jgi:hypothetical protein